LAAETGGDAPALAASDAPASTEATEAHAPTLATDPEGSLARSADAPSSPSAIETGSVQPAGDRAAIRTARVVSDVKMRAGPSNGDAVLAIVPRGRSVDVVGGCRAWCEVVHAGQRGWVYKGFLGAAPPIAGERRAEGTAPSSR
jgi:hypothetical protein